MREETRFRGLAVMLSGMAILAAGPAVAWDVAIGTNQLEFALYVDSFSGAAPTWTTIDERARASDTPGPTVPVVWITQTWDPIAETWPSDQLTASEGITDGSIYNDDIEIEFWGSAEAFVFGSVATGDAVGAGVAYDFEFIMAPFTAANIFLDDLETYVYLQSDPGDVGNAFAQAKLYSTDVDVNDPGGANMPWGSGIYSIEAGVPPVDTQPSLSIPFVNSTPSPVTYNFRFEASVSVFAVSEPALGSALLLGTPCLTGLRRARVRNSDARPVPAPFNPPRAPRSAGSRPGRPCPTR